MLVFGVVGLVLAAVVGGTLVAGGIAAHNLDDKIVAAQDRMGAALTRLTLTMDSVAQSVDSAGGTLATSRDGVAHAADALNDVADTAGTLADALDVSVAGQQPFASAADALRTLETRVRVFQSDATTLAANLDENVADVAQIASEVRDMRSQVAELAGAVTTFASTREVVSLAVGGIVLAGLLTVWEAVLAAAIAWAGLRLRRKATDESALAAAPVRDPFADGPVADAPAVDGPPSSREGVDPRG
jgi:outer membrane murein-binding lipoprotein Lpp